MLVVHVVLMASVMGFQVPFRVDTFLILLDTAIRERLYILIYRSPPLWRMPPFIINHVFEYVTVAVHARQGWR